MGISSNTEDFIKKATLLYGSEFNYSEVDYKSAKSKVTIICPLHGKYQLKPNAHLNGTGCPTCGIQRRNSLNKFSTESFVESAKEVHGELFDYSKVKYVSSKAKVEIICRKHGVFRMNKDNHVCGKQGCPVCGAEKCSVTNTRSQEDFITLANKKHNNLYSYENTVYTRSSEKVLITCKNHGDFLQSACAHLMGRGCSKCQRSGYCKGKPGSFYVLISGGYTKVGITNREVRLRVKAISKSSGEDFNIFTQYLFKDGEVAYNLEQTTLKWLRNNYTPVSEIFDGSTECFTSVDSLKLTQFVLSVIQEAANSPQQH